MPKLAIIDPNPAAAGGERYVYGLVSGLLQNPASREWEITLLLPRLNSAGYEMPWLNNLEGPNLTIKFLRDDWLRSTMDRLSKAGRIMGIKGTSRLQQAIPGLLRRSNIPAIREIAGEVRIWIESYCRQNNFDVVYYPFPYLVDCPDIDAPLVSTPHDFNYKSMESLHPAHRQMMEEEVPRWLSKSERLVVSSRFIADELERYYPEHSRKVRIIRTGIPGPGRKYAQDELSEFRARLDLPERFLLTAAWISPHKNQKVVFEALAMLKKEGLSLPYVCIGPNAYQLAPDYRGWKFPYVEEILETAQKGGLQAGRDFLQLGFVAESELEKLYQLATATVVASLYEAGSFPLIEATRLSCPVICSDIAPLMEHVESLDGNAWTFAATDPHDLARAIREVAAAPEGARARAAVAARRVSELHSWERAAGEYVAVFEELARKPSQAGS